MKAYVITLTDLPESVEAAERCIASGKVFGIDVEMSEGIGKDIAMDLFKNEKLFFQFFNRDPAVFEAVVGCFLSHYNLWKNIISTNESCIILEHDAIFVEPVPALTSGSIINLGKPSWGEYKIHDQVGIFPIFSSKRGYLLGAHAYYVTPKGAEQLIQHAKNAGILPADLFIDANHIRGVKETWPWVVEAKDRFTTIQKEKGCLSKFGYNENYKILS